MMKRLPMFAIALAAAALVLPIATQAKALQRSQQLRVQLVLPVEFGPFAGCADGASYGITANGFRGTGTTCLLSGTDFLPCGGRDTFCRDLATHTVLNLSPLGTIEFDANQHEVITAFDPVTGAFSVQITWSGRVTAATRTFQKLVGAPVSGGGPTSFDATGAQTGNLAFVIGETMR
jgi:hypothetical protein